MRRKLLLFAAIATLTPALTIVGVWGLQSYRARAELDAAYQRAHKLGIFTSMEQIYALAPPGATKGRKLGDWARTLSDTELHAVTWDPSVTAPITLTDGLPDLVEEVLGQSNGWQNHKDLNEELDNRLSFAGSVAVYALTYRGSQLAKTDFKETQRCFRLAASLSDALSKSLLANVQFGGQASSLGIDWALTSAIYKDPDLNWSSLYDLVTAHRASPSQKVLLQVACADDLARITASLHDDSRTFRLLPKGGSSPAEEIRQATIAVLDFYCDVLPSVTPDMTSAQIREVWSRLREEVLDETPDTGVRHRLEEAIASRPPLIPSKRERVPMELLPLYIAASRAGGNEPVGISRAKDKYGSPVRFKKLAAGFILYSFGKNGRDDAGQGDDRRIRIEKGIARPAAP